MAKGKRTGTIISTGLLVLLFWGIGLFWIDFLCRIVTGDFADRQVSVTPVSLIDPGMEAGSDLCPPSFGIHLDSIEMNGTALGIAQMDSLCSSDYFLSQNINKDDWEAIYYDAQSGQIRYSFFEGPVQKANEQFVLYAGPKGISEDPSEENGRFEDPIAYGDQYGCFVYDRSMRQFFRITFAALKQDETGRPYIADVREVFQGPVLSGDQTYQPIQIGTLAKSRDLGIYFTGPMRRISQEEGPEESSDGWAGRGRNSWKEYDVGYKNTAGDFLLVLDRSGRIDRLDKKTLEIAGTAGRLPSPKGLFSSQTEGIPAKLSAYQIFPISRQEGDKIVYKGCCAAAAAPEGFSKSIIFYDSKGQAVNCYGDHYRLKDNRFVIEENRLTDSIMNRAGGPLLMVIRLFVENLQPPVFNLASFAASDLFEARSGFRALFVRPNGFAGILSRIRDVTWLRRIWLVLLMILPSLLLGLVLGWGIRRKAMRLGYSSGAGYGWFVLGILFGIPAWITFGLVRSRETLVTCENCGSLRRPDQDLCHTCRAGWDLKHLEAPGWRVVEPIDNSPQEEKQTMRDSVQSEKDRL